MLARKYPMWSRTQEWILRMAPMKAVTHMHRYFDEHEQLAGGGQVELEGDAFRLQTLPTPTCHDIRDLAATHNYLQLLDNCADLANRFLSNWSDANGGDFHPQGHLVQRFIILPAVKAAAETRFLLRAIPSSELIYTLPDGTRSLVMPPLDYPYDFDPNQDPPQGEPGVGGVGPAGGHSDSGSDHEGTSMGFQPSPSEQPGSSKVARTGDLPTTAAENAPPQAPPEQWYN
jgi:hypothetical protein